jgi:hypothetical protein
MEGWIGIGSFLESSCGSMDEWRVGLIKREERRESAEEQKRKPHPKSCAPFQRRAQQKRKFERSRANVCRRVWLLCCTLPARVLMQQANRSEA